MIALEMFHFSWLIYGNVLYYSSENTCFSENMLLGYLMLGILIIGYFHLFLFGLIICILSVVVMKRLFEKNKK